MSRSRPMECNISRVTSAQGQATDWIVGHTFSVYTTSGVNTLFTNNQGTQFHMGTEAGEIVYQL